MATKKNTKLQFYLKAHFKEFQDASSDRLKALYSDFSNQELLNEYAYKTNISFWKHVILESNIQGYLDSTNYATVINVEQLPSKFQIPVLGKPLSLDCVLSTLEEEEQLMSLNTFRKQYSPSSFLQRIYSSLLSNQNDDELYIVMPTLKLIVNRILQDVKEHGDYLFTFTRFKSKYAHQFVNELELTDNDLMCVIEYMQKKHHIAFMDHVQGYCASYKVIKFPIENNQYQKITEHDRAIVALRTTSFALTSQIESFEKEAKQLATEAIQEKQRNHKAKALYCYKRKKTLDAIIEKRLKSVETIETVLIKVESSNDDIQVMKAFNMGANALSNLLKSEELSINSIDDAIEKIHHALEDQKQIEEAISYNDDANDAELERELAQLTVDEDKQDIEQEIAEIEKMFSDIQTSDTLLLKATNTLENLRLLQTLTDQN